MKKKYVIVGTGVRAYHMFSKSIAENFSDIAYIGGIYDINKKRAEYFQKISCPDANIYDNFDDMLLHEKPDAVIVTTVDSFHHEYIIKAMHEGYDVISEKPLTTDHKKVKQILAAQKATGRDIKVIFNCRFMPFVKRIKELLAGGIVGDIYNVDYEYLLDRSHGADYYRRWHRYEKNSGSLLVHKSTHHFDMINWWIGQTPQTVYANGTLRFYGANRKSNYERCSDCKDDDCELRFKHHNDEFFKGMYFEPEVVDGYHRDMCLFSDKIDIYDTMSLSVKYNEGAILSYSLVTYSPYEGWKVAITGEKGRLEAATFDSGENKDLKHNYIKFYATDGEIITYKLPKVSGDHGGGDIRLMKQLILGTEHDPLSQVADVTQGINSAMIGISANLSIKDGRAHDIKELLSE